MPAPKPPVILYEDNHLLAVNKPFGMLSQGDTTGDVSVFEWAKEYVRKQYNKPGNVYLALLHRIDRPVGGVLLLAKTSKAAARLTDQFKGRTVQKTYLAVTERVPDEPTGTLKHFLKKLPGKNIVRAYDKPAYGAQEAELSYTVLEADGNRALLEVKPHTGRQHQIRVQLARMGCTLVGDVKYGKTAFLPDQSIALFSHVLQLEHPTTGKLLTVTAYPPLQAPWDAFDYLQKVTANS
jgi:23S rRNA pseudouridine1911/1915/1917 synthase